MYTRGRPIRRRRRDGEAQEVGGIEINSPTRKTTLEMTSYCGMRLMEMQELKNQEYVCELKRNKTYSYKKKIHEKESLNIHIQFSISFGWTFAEERLLKEETARRDKK